jgi:hypothetical protein
MHALLNFFLAAEPKGLGTRATGQSQAGGVVFVEDGVVGRLLIFEDSRFRVDIRLESAVAIEVIG